MRNVDLHALGIAVLAGSASVAVSPLPVFSDEALSFLDDLSRSLLRDKAASRFTDVVSFAFWARRGNLMQKKETYAKRGISGASNIGRGLALHIAPSNVPINFAFSFAFALLSGCPSVVRVPSRAFDQVSVFLDVVTDVLSRHGQICARTAFASWPSDSPVTKALSAVSDVRIIWGGDETVNLIRSLPAKPRTVDVTFADRRSMCLLDGGYVAGLGEGDLQALVKGFYNDTYLMDQNACSSPRAVIWLGDGRTEMARTRFWDALAAYASPRYEMSPSALMGKCVGACLDLARGHATRVDFGRPLAIRAETEGPADPIERSSGYFYECAISSLDELSPAITERTQTLTYAGIDPESVRELAIANHLLGIDRIVPVGSALDIDVVWDGYDLISALSRIVDVR